MSLSEYINNNKIVKILINNADKFLFIIDKSDILHFVNDFFLEKFSYNSSDLLNINIKKIIAENENLIDKSFYELIINSNIEEIKIKNKYGAIFKCSLFYDLIVIDDIEYMLLIISEIKEKNEDMRLFDYIFHKSFTPKALIKFDSLVFSDINEAALKNIGFKREDLIGKSVFDFNFLDEDKIIKLKKDLEKNREIHNLFFDIKIADNKIRKLEVDVFLIKIENEKYIFVNSNDYTEKYINDKRNYEVELSYKHIFENSNIGIFEIDNEWNILLTNRKFLSILDIEDIEEYNSKNHNFSEFVPDSLEFNYLNMELLKKSEISNLEIKLKTISGKIIYVLLNIGKKYDIYDNIFRFYGSIIDISVQKKLEENLKMNYEFTENLIENLPLGMFYKNQQGVYIKCNNKFSENLGLRKEEIIGKTVFDITDEDLAKVYNKADQDLIQSKGKQEYQAKVKFYDNKLHDIIFNKVAILDKENNVLGLLGLMTDITELVEVRKELEREKEKLSNILKTIDDVIWAASYDTKKMIYINDAVYKLFDAEGNIFYDMTKFGDFVYADDIEKYNEAKNKLINNEFVINHYRILTLKGKIKWVEEKIWVIKDINVENKYFYGIIRDITNIKIYELKLIEKSELINTLSLSSIEILENKEFLLGLERSLTLITNVLKMGGFFYYEKSENNNSFLLKLKKICSKSSIDCHCKEEIFLTDETFLKENELNINPIIYDNRFDEIIGKFIFENDNLKAYILIPLSINSDLRGFVGFIDCKEKYLVEDEKRLLNTFSHIIYKALERELYQKDLLYAKKLAEELNNMKSSFLANMSHDIRTPMNGIIGFLDLLSETKLDDEQREYLNEIKESSKILLKIIDEILDFSKIEAGLMKIESVPFNLIKEIENTVMTFALKAEEKKLDYNLYINPNIEYELIGDPLRLKQVLNNLINNAIKFTEKGFIDVSVDINEETDDSMNLNFKISDSGIGISEENLQKLFQPFMQADDSICRKYGGTGLGLAISSKILELMGSNLLVESKENFGTTFSFSINFKKSDKKINIISKKIKKLKNISAIILDNNQKFKNILTKYLEKIDISVIEFDKNILKNNRKYLLFINKSNIDNIGLNNYLKSSENIIQFEIINFSEKINKNKEKKYIVKPLKISVFYEEIDNALSNSDLILIDENKNYADKNEKNLENLIKKILIVDDNVINQKLILSILDKKGFECKIANNGLEAVNILKNEEFDIVLMDIQMPVLDGFEATKKIRKMPIKQPIIIALTASVSTDEKGKCISDGMDDFLTKPIDKDKLLNLINFYEKSKNKYER